MTHRVRMMLLCGALFVYAPAVAAVPLEFNYQGVLRQYGIPVTGTRDVTFRLFDHPTAGAQVWSQTVQGVQVTSGAFNTVLTLPAEGIDWRTANFWFEVSIDNKSFAPRQKLVSQFYALHSRTSEGLSAASGRAAHVYVGTVESAVFGASSTTIRGDLVVYGLLSSNTVTTAAIQNAAVTGAKLAPNAVTGAHIEDGTIRSADIADGSVTSDKIMDGTIGTGDIADGAVTNIKIGSGLDAGKITTGMLPFHQYSAHGDLVHEGYLDNNNGGDLLTRNQADERYVNHGEEWSVVNEMINSVSASKVTPGMFPEGHFTVNGNLGAKKMFIHKNEEDVNDYDAHLIVRGHVNMFGASMTNFNPGVLYGPFPSDGLVYGYVYASATYDNGFNVYVGKSETQLEIRGQTNVPRGSVGSACVPIRRGEYFKFNTFSTGHHSHKFFYMPFGGN